MSTKKNEKDGLVRLQKVIAECGVTSRRKAEQLITSGKVMVNEEVVTELGTKVNPQTDSIRVEDQLIDLNLVDKIYLVLNKPRGYVTTVSDPEGRRTVMDLCGGIEARIFPVGRLDYYSEGLLIMTNDGDLANKIMHPRYEIMKVYEVKVFGLVDAELLAKLKKGISTEDGVLKPKSVRVVEQLPGKTWLEFRLTEGKNREIRRLCEAVGLTIDKLRRVAIEGLSIVGIRPGDYNIISKKDLLKHLGMDAQGKKINSRPVYKSKKSSIEPGSRRMKRKTSVMSKKADDPTFTKFRKDTYLKTVREQEEKRRRIAAGEE